VFATTAAAETAPIVNIVIFAASSGRDGHIGHFGRLNIFGATGTLDSTWHFWRLFFYVVPVVFLFCWPVAA